jgi:hypothetical protein
VFVVIQSTHQTSPVSQPESMALLQWTSSVRSSGICIRLLSRSSESCWGDVHYITQPMHDKTVDVHTTSLSLKCVTSSKSNRFSCCNAHEISYLVLNPTCLQEHERNFCFTASTFDPLILFSFSWMSLYILLFLTTYLWYFPTLL